MTSRAKGAEEDRKLIIEEILSSKDFAMIHKKIIPAIKEAIREKAVAQLGLLRSTYLYSFENSLRFLTKAEREFIDAQVKPSCGGE